jgi:hypothetical protein
MKKIDTVQEAPAIIWSPKDFSAMQPFRKAWIVICRLNLTMFHARGSLLMIKVLQILPICSPKLQIGPSIVQHGIAAHSFYWPAGFKIRDDPSRWSR